MPINRHNFANIKRIKQIDPITKQCIIFNSMSDVYRRLGISFKPLTKAINEKIIYHGHLWEFVDNQE